MPQEWIMEEALELWGEEAQMLMVVEELGELSHEILKYLRAYGIEKAEARTRIAGEHADVSIMLDQLAFIMQKYDKENLYSYSELKRGFTSTKVNRLVNNLEKSRGLKK